MAWRLGGGHPRQMAVAVRTFEARRGRIGVDLARNDFPAGEMDLKQRRIVVVGTLATNPYAGMAWMHMQIAAGLLRLGHDVYYMETTPNWPYDPLRQARVNDSDYAAPYLARVADRFGMGERWAFRRSFSDKQWLGMSRQ